MAGRGDRPLSPLGAALDVFQLRALLTAVAHARELAAGAVVDADFLLAARRAFLPLPFDRPRAVHTEPFPPEPADVDSDLAGRRVAVVASGGSGALACVVGVARALEEAGARPSLYSLCSGSALFGFPLAAGLPAEEVARFALSLDARKLVDPQWRRLLALVPTLGRGFAGILAGDRIEQTYRELLGDLTLGELPTPAYVPIWNIEENRLEYLGPRTYPHVSVARAVRMAIALPLFLNPVELDGSHWCDGGLVEILPVRPVLELERKPDVVFAVQAFYPSEFAGEDVRGWEREPLSILRIASQVRTAQHVELARQNLAWLRRECDTRLVEPVPYRMVRGVGFYREFLETSEWPDFMRLGRAATRKALRGTALPTSA